MKYICIPAMVLAAASARGDVVFSQPPSASGGLVMSSWVEPDGSDSDMYAWDSFVLDADSAITRVSWRGGYSYGAPYGHVHNFSVHFYASTAADTQPLCGWPEPEETIFLAEYFVGGTAGETAAGVFGGVQMYDYSYDLPTPFQATAGVKYWIKIEGYQNTFPDWGVTVGTGGNGSHFHFSTGMHMFYFASYDLAFTLYVPLQSDFDGDDDVDLVDFAHLVACVGGPDQPPGLPSCDDADLDGDTDVDLIDFGLFQRCYGGKNAPPSCE